MSWRWTTEPAEIAGAEALGLEQRFPSQGEAESWLGEFYPELMEGGVRSVTLYEADRRVYGPMGLEPEIT